MTDLTGKWRLLVQPVDPRDISHHVGTSRYRVYFFDRTAPDTRDARAADALVADEYEISGADIPEVLDWAASEAGRRPFVLYLLAERDGVKTLFRLAGLDLSLGPLM